MPSVFFRGPLKEYQKNPIDGCSTGLVPKIEAEVPLWLFRLLNRMKSATRVSGLVICIQFGGTAGSLS